MIKGVRKPDEAARLGLSSRLMVRIGALLKKGVAISPVLLEGARPGSPLEEALLAPALLEQAATLSPETIGKAFPTSASLPAITITTADDAARVLCLQEELDADEWSIPAQPAPAQPLPLAPGGIGNALAMPQQQAGFNAQQSGPGVFAPQELEKLRVKLLTAGKPEERSEALRVLCLAPIAPEDKVDVLLQALNDREASVRAEAAGLLTIAGADRDIAEALAALNHADLHRREAALERLSRLVTQNARDIDIGAIAVSAMATLRNDTAGAQTGRLMDLLRVCAPQLARNSARIAELMRVVLGLVAGVARRGASPRELENAVNPAYKLICAIGNVAPQHLIPVLHAERERCTDLVSEALLLQLLLDLTPVNAADEENILKLATAYLGRDTDEGRDSRAVGSRLLRRGERALAALCDAFNEATPTAQKYFMMLMDDLSRMHRMPGPLLERAATLVLQSLKTGSKPLSMAAAQCRFITDPAISDELRGELAECLVNSASDFIFQFDIEKVEQTIAQMGSPALDVLLHRLSSQRPRNERVRAVRLLGNLALEMKAPKGQLARVQQGVTDALRRVQSLALEPDFPDRGELLCAMGKLAACPAASKEAGTVIERTLMEAARSSNLAVSSRALEGLTHLAASRRAQPELVAGTSVLLRKLLDGTPFEIGTEEKKVNGEKVIEISGGENYTAILPLALQGLARVACSPNCPHAITKDILSLLITCWRRVCSAEVVWGPANTALLIQSLKEIGMLKTITAEQRAELLKAFVPRLMQTSVMHAITEILASDDTPTSANNALTVGVAIFSRRGPDAQFQMEDRPEILKALSRIAARRNLGGSGAEGIEKMRNFKRMVVEELFKGMRDDVSGAYESLLSIREKGTLPTDIKEEVEKRLRELHAVVMA